MSGEMPKFGLVQTVAPTAQTVTTAEAKTHCRVTHSSDDTYIGTLTEVAREWIEDYTHRPSLVATYRLTMQSFPTSILLPRVPLISVSSLKYIDTDGNQQTWDSANYVAETDYEPGVIVPAWNVSWPAFRGVPNAVEVLFTAGYATAGDIPTAMKQAALILVNDMYSIRSNVVDSRLRDLEAVESLLAPLRIMEFS